MARLFDKPEDLVALVAAAFLTCLMVYGFVAVRGTERQLRGKRGGALSHVIFIVVAAVLVGQVLTTLTLALFAWDRVSTAEARLVLTLAKEIIEVTAVLWAVRSVLGLAKNPSLGARMGAIEDDVANPQQT
jgi:hypothetical protein